MSPPRRPAARAVLLAAAVALAACTDHPTDARPGPAPPEGTPGQAVTLQAVRCLADRAALTVACAAAAPDAGDASGILYGGQGVYVTLASSNVAYDGGTGQFTFDVTVANLLPQPIGTTDGVSVDPGGVRVWFASGPEVTGGSGSASVVPDGFDTFTAAGQAYYAYGQVLVQNQVSSARTWTLVMPPTVTTFAFTVYVSSPVQWPDGYVSLDGELPGAAFGPLHPGDTHTLTATVRTAVGNAVPGATVTFGTTDPLCATVDASGLVTGVRAASCTITASSDIGGTPVSGGRAFDVTGTTRVWAGTASTDWAAGGNWAAGLVPATVDSVQVPAAAPNQPALSSAVQVSNVTVEDGATLSLGAFDLTTTGDVWTGATGGILGTGGTLLLAGADRSIQGSVDRATVTGRYALSGNLTLGAPARVEGGRLRSAGWRVRVQSQ